MQSASAQFLNRPTTIDLPAWPVARCEQCCVCRLVVLRHLVNHILAKEKSLWQSYFTKRNLLHPETIVAVTVETRTSVHMVYPHLIR